MRNGQGVGEGLTVSRGGVIHGFLHVEFGFDDGDIDRIARRAARPGDGGCVGEDGAILVAGFVQHAGDHLDEEGVVIRHVISGGSRIAKGEGQVAARTARRGDGGGGQRAIVIRSQQAAAGRCRGDDLMANIFQACGQIIRHLQVGGQAFRQGNEEIESDLGANGIRGRGGVEFVNLWHSQGSIGASCRSIIVERAAHAILTVAFAGFGT